VQTVELKVCGPATAVAQEAELAWRLAALAADRVPVDLEVAALVGDRLIDCAGVAVAALERAPVRDARSQALRHPRATGATLLGLPDDVRVHCEWAAAANATAVRELDFHDNVFDAEIGHPGDMIPAVLAVCQQAGRSGADLLRGIVTAYEVHVALCKAIALHARAFDHVGHLAPAMAAGIGAALDLDAPTIREAIRHAVQAGYGPGQARKGQISTWKSYAPGHASLVAINAVDRAMRGETSPAQAFEGEQGLFAMLGGPGWAGEIRLAEPGEPRRLALETFTKEHSAGYHGQAAIDLAFRLRSRLDPADVRSIVYHTKRRTHVAMGSGSGDARKYDPAASRETLDHSLMYLMAVALQDGEWHHVRSYLPERAGRPDTVALWRRISTAEDPEWNERYARPGGLEKDHGGRAVVVLEDGAVIEDEIAVPNAHPRGAAPMDSARYLLKFGALVEDQVEACEIDRFIGAVRALPQLAAGTLHRLHIQSRVRPSEGDRHGIY
jgi:2-methylcitrate dehydratase